MLTREYVRSSPRWGVVKSLALIGAGPVGLVHRQKVRFFQKKNPTSVVESYKATYRHKLTLLRKQKKLLALSFFSFWTQLGHWILSYMNYCNAHACMSGGGCAGVA